VTIALITLGFLALVIAIVAVHDLTQRKHAVTRNFPVIGHLRYFFEEMGQPLRQYLFAGDLDERPYNRVTRSWVYASAKGQNNLVGFGSQIDHNQLGRTLIVPSMYPTLTPANTTDADLPRPKTIGAKRPQPYQPRRFANIAGMSYGALSPNAVRALSRGAKMAGCYMSTGEGSISTRQTRKSRPQTRWSPAGGGTRPSAEAGGGHGEAEAVQHFSEPAHGVLFLGP